MLRRNLSDDTQASLNSAMIWSLMAILFITAVVPASLFATNRIQDLSAEESYFNPEKIEDFNQHMTPMNSNSESSADQYIDYKYDNETGAQFYTNNGLYTRNLTGNEYNEYLAGQTSDDTGTFQDYSYLNIQINKTTSELIEDDLKKVRFTAEFPRNSSVTITSDILYGVYGESTTTYTLKEKNFNVTTDMEEYEMEIDYSKLLDADSTVDGKDFNALRLAIEPENSDYNQDLQPGDSLKFNIDLFHSTSAMSAFWTVNVVSGLLGGFLMIAAVFSTPWVDLKDLTGRF